MGTAFFVWFLCETSLADQVSLPDDHAPIGIMGEHNHKTGEWMASYRDGIEGQDEELNPNMVPTARPDLSSRKSVKGFAGLNLYKPKGAFSDNRLAVEIGWSLYQDLDGPQLKNGYSSTIGWQFSI